MQRKHMTPEEVERAMQDRSMLEDFDDDEDDDEDEDLFDFSFFDIP